MFKDIKDISPELEYDVCIVGSGPAGISVARQLFDSGLRIVMLESGGIDPEPEYQQFNQGENSGPSFLSLSASRLRCFGGASRIWAGKCAPFRDHEFEKKPFIPLSGWPISLDDLKVYYQQAANMLGLSYEKFYNTEYFQDTFHGVSYREFNRNASLLSGYVVQASNEKNRNFGEKYRKSFQVSSNIDVIFHSTVTKLNLKKSKSVKSVSIADLNGNQAVIRAKIFVLACGALENPRILLASNNDIKNGVGNGSDFVGRCFMSHPGIDNVAEIYKTKSKGCIEDSRHQDSYLVQFESNDAELRRQEMLRHGLSISPYEQLSHLSTIYNGKILRDFGKLFKNFSLSDIYRKRSCRNKGKYDYMIADLSVALEQPPLRENRVSLLSKKDILGVPMIDVYWSRLSEIERRTVLRSTKTLARELGLLGLGKVRLSKRLLTGKVFDFHDPVNHHIGTTRMSDSKDGSMTISVESHDTVPGY